MVGQATFPVLLLVGDGRPLENKIKNKSEVFSHKDFENSCRESNRDKIIFF